MGARKKAKPTARLRLEPLGLHIPRPGTVGPEHSVSDKKTLTCSDPAPHGWAGGRAASGSKGQRPKGILFRAWDRLSPNVSPLPADAAAGWDLCFDQAVVFIEDAIQVGGASLRWLGPGSSPGPWGLGNGRPDGPVTLRHPGAKAEVGKPCGPRNRHGLAFGHSLFESLLEQVGA